MDAACPRLGRNVTGELCDGNRFDATPMPSQSELYGRQRLALGERADGLLTGLVNDLT